MRREPTTTDELLKNFVAAAVVFAVVYGLALTAVMIGRLL
jgi:hypothetical protein